MLGCNLRESRREFHRTLPEYTRLDLKRSILGVGILRLPEGRDWFREYLAVTEGGTVPDIIFLYKNSLIVVKPFFEGKNR